MSEAMPQVTDGELFMVNTLIVRPERRVAYLQELESVLPQVRELDGCLLLEVGERADAPATFILIERWRNGLEYANEYLTLPFFQTYISRTENMYAQPRDVVVLATIPPEG
jgi:quinol monooxygenase YgiN